MSALYVTITVLNEDTSEREVRLPARYVVCQRCLGNGKHDHRAFANGITSDEWNGPDWDDESREAYMRGEYGVICERCRGLRVELEVDEEALTEEQREAWDEHLEVERALAEDEASELRLRMMESGGFNG